VDIALHSEGSSRKSLGGGRERERSGRFDFLQVAMLEIKTCKTT